MEGSKEVPIQGESLQVFEGQGFKIRSVVRDGDVWFVAKDVAKALGYSNTNDVLIRHVDDEDKLTSRITMAGQKRAMTAINEPGMYSLIFVSQLPIAKEFKHWVAEVVAQFRQDMYISKKMYDELADKYQALVERVQRLEEQQPKASLTPPLKRRRTPTEAATELADLELLPRVKNPERSY